MAIFYPDILTETSARRPFSYSEKDAILYALGIGMGENENALPFVYEKNLKIVPTAVTVLGGTIMPQLTPRQGYRKSSYDFAKVVHGEQEVQIFRPLKAADALFTETCTTHVEDKGEGRGAVVVTETLWTDCDGAKVAKLVNSIFARGDGGFGGPKGEKRAVQARPERAPDIRAKLASRPDQALLYRLTGDHNPLHADPEVAKNVGFPAPIMHGLCTFGMTCRAVLEHCVGYDSDRILSHSGRFTAPFFPGETLHVDMWLDGDQVQFEASSVERGVMVIGGGQSKLRSE